MKLSIIAPWPLQTSSPLNAMSLLYAQRLKHPFHIKFITPQKQFKTAQDEINFLKKSIENVSLEKGELVICDPSGEHMSSERLAHWVEKQNINGLKSLCFVVGGPNGVPADIYKPKTHFDRKLPLVLSLSHLTFVHELAMVILLEQIFRCQCILSHHPYHRGQPSEFSKFTK